MNTAPIYPQDFRVELERDGITQEDLLEQQYIAEQVRADLEYEAYMSKNGLTLEDLERELDRAD